MSERFEEYIRDGKTENQAYSLAITSLGDIDELLAGVMPSDEFVKHVNYFRRRNAKYIAIGVAMYIISAAFLIGLVGLGVLLDNPEVYSIVGVIVLLLISAVATGLIIYSNMSTPLEYKDYSKESKMEFSNLDVKHARILNNILTIYWTIIAFIYLAISFTTMLWGITWIIWVLASVFQAILKLVFEIKYGGK
jgi:F0F1-type ATP synthase assembly protein I